MERRKSGLTGSKPQISKRATDARSRPSATKKKFKKTDIATTAMGAIPEKRGLKNAGAKKPSGAGKASTSVPVSGPVSGIVKSGGGQRELAINVKTARRRKLSSTLWLYRQLNDPFVARAKADGFASRAAYKLIELDDKFGLIKPGAKIVDLGSAPGGWCQVAVQRGAAKVIGIDYLAMDAVAGADILEMDFLDDDAPEKLKGKLGGAANVVLSDMATPTTGHKSTDHLRIVALAEAALDFAMDVLAPGGSFVSKVFAGGAEGELLNLLKKNFATVKHAKPVASRSGSAEKYVVATGFRGSKK